MKTLYDKLDVTRDASTSDIEHSYLHSLNDHAAGNSTRSLRKQDQLRVQQVRQAYLTLSSPSRRLEYDLKLDQQEQARLRRMERLGTAFGLALLLAGFALVVRGIYLFQTIAPVEADRSVQQQFTVLASENTPPSTAQQAPARSTHPGPSLPQ